MKSIQCPGVFEIVDGELRCTQCGSITTASVIALLQTPGVKFSGTDWKFGYPHKFHLTTTRGENVKFYSKHLHEATALQLAEFDKLSRRTFGIAWGRKQEDGIFYSAPKTTNPYGWQLSGRIGLNGRIEHTVPVDMPRVAKILESAGSTIS